MNYDFILGNLYFNYNLLVCQILLFNLFFYGNHLVGSRLTEMVPNPEKCAQDSAIGNKWNSSPSRDWDKRLECAESGIVEKDWLSTATGYTYV